MIKGLNLLSGRKAFQFILEELKIPVPEMPTFRYNSPTRMQNIPKPKGERDQLGYRHGSSSAELAGDVRKLESERKATSFEFFAQRVKEWQKREKIIDDAA